MRRVLIISPRFPPVNAPDMQRVRLMLPHLAGLGWEPVVLAVDPDYVEGAVLEPLLEKTYPRDIEVLRVRGLPQRWTRPFGIGSLWWRCGHALRRTGDALIERGRFDLVFFSTTLFGAFTLGPRWRQKFGVPYVLDYQDPWVSDYYIRTGTRPPGGPLRYGLSQYFARKHEPTVVRFAAAIIAVSPAYLTDLDRRYPEGATQRLTARIPFASSSADFVVAREHPPARSLIPFADGSLHLVYTGRGGTDMARALRILFKAFHIYLDSSHVVRKPPVHFHFIGTDYAPAGLAKHTILPVAVEEGIAPHVSEHCLRAPYFEALHYLSRADTILILGSDDPSYNASKLHTCLLAGRPILCIGHNDSPLVAAARQHANTAVFAFGGPISDAECAFSLCRDYFERQRHALRPPTSVASYIPDAAGMTQKLAGLFDEVLTRSVDRATPAKTPLSSIRAAPPP